MFSGYLILLTEVENRNFQFPGYLACYIIFSICKELSFLNPIEMGVQRYSIFQNFKLIQNYFLIFFKSFCLIQHLCNYICPVKRVQK